MPLETLPWLERSGRHAPIVPKACKQHPKKHAVKHSFN